MLEGDDGGPGGVGAAGSFGGGRARAVHSGMGL